MVNHKVHLEESPHIQKTKELEKKEHLVVETEDQPNQSEHVFQVSDQKQSVEPFQVESFDLLRQLSLHSQDQKDDLPILMGP